MKRILSTMLALTLIFTSISIGIPSYAADEFDTPVPEFTAMKTDVANKVSVTAYEKGLELIVNSSYTDISKDPYKEEIIRMSTLGIVKQYGDRKFYPGYDATGYDALGVLVRLAGNENQVMQRVYAQAGDTTDTESIKLLMNQEYLNEALTLGIITQTEIVNLQGPITREKLAVWVARQLNLQPVFTQETVFSFNDWESVNPTYRSLIESIVSQGVIPIKTSGDFGPKDTIKRGELAKIAKSTLENNYAAMNISVGYGLVIGVAPEEIYEDGDTITRNTITVKNTDGTVTDLVSEMHTKNTQQYDFVSYKSGVPSNNRNVILGDEIEYLIQNDKVMYVQVLDHDSVLKKISANTLADEFSVFHYGTVSEIKSKNQVKAGQNVKTEIYRVVDVTGDVFDIVVDENLYTGYRDDIITFKDELVGGVKFLKEGDVLEYLVNPDNEVIYIKVAPLEAKTISGTIRMVSDITDTEPATITVFGYDDLVYQYPVAPYADLKINQRYTSIGEFVYGMPVTLKIANGYIISAEGESYTGDPGYIPDYGKMRMGTVESIYQQSINVELENGTFIAINIKPGTTILKNGESVPLTTLKIGDKVKAYYNDIYSDSAARIEIEAPEIIFQIIYKGKIKNVSESKGLIEFIGADGRSNPEYILNNDWVPADDYSINLDFDERTEIYKGNEKLSVDMLEKEYTNYTAYVVVEKKYGKERVVKLSVSTGRESNYSSFVKNTDQAIGKFEIGTKENFNLTEGTIIIKDGLVVPNSKLKAWDTVFVVAESPRGSFSDNALVVKVVTPFDNIFDSIRIGALEKVNTNSLTLKNYTYYTNSGLNAVNKNETGNFRFFSDTKILDVTNPDAKVTIKPTQFYHMPYSREENRDSSYGYYTKGLEFDRYYTFMVVDNQDDSIIAMHLRHKGLLEGQNIDDNAYYEDEVADELEKTFRNAILSRGTVVRDDETWDRFEITDSHDYTEYTGRWNSNTANIYVEYSNAIVIKNNKVISADEVYIGDYLYIMRINEEALVIFVES